MSPYGAFCALVAVMGSVVVLGVLCVAHLERLAGRQARGATRLAASPRRE